MEIRDLRPAELDDLLSLYRHLHDADHPMPARDVVLATWRELLASPRHAIFGGFVDGTLSRAARSPWSRTCRAVAGAHGVIA